MLVLCFVVTLLFAIVEASSHVGEDDLTQSKAMICAVLKNEESYVDEWLQYHKHLGFDQIHLYDNNAEPSKYLSGLHHVYGDFVKIVRWGAQGTKQQQPTYTDFFAKHKQNNTWAAFLDVDEFIVLRKHVSIKDFLRDLAPKGGSVVLNWSQMSNNGAQKREPGLTVSRFTRSSKNLDKNIKTISYLPHAKEVAVQSAILRAGHPTVDVQGRPQPNDATLVENNAGNRDVAYINRYHTKSLEEFLQKKQRNRADTVQQEVVQAFNEFNLPYSEIEDTAARDFYFKSYFGPKLFTQLFACNGTHSSGPKGSHRVYKHSGDESERNH